MRMVHGMKARLVIMVLLIPITFSLCGMHGDSNNGDRLLILDETIDAMPNHVINIYAFPEADTPVHQEFVGRASDPIHYIVEQGNYHHLITRLHAITEDEINQRDEYGNTPLHFAGRLLSYKKVDILLQHGADPEVINDNEEDVLDVMPVYDLGRNMHLGIKNIMQPQFVIQALLQLAAYKHPYILINTPEAEMHCIQELSTLIQTHGIQELSMLLKEKLNGGH